MKYALLIIVLVTLLPVPLQANPQAEQQLQQGEFVFRAAGCKACHTDAENEGAALAGGHRLQTPFGVFVTPNISPDKQTGIGQWSAEDFKRALREGKAPTGQHYYPAFPYPAYTQLTDDDIAALWVYLQAQPAINKSNAKHELNWKAPPRRLIAVWKWLYFTEGAYTPDPMHSQSWNRGAYLANAAAHCGECHTPRTRLGGLDNEKRYAGHKQGPEESTIPNITPDKDTGIGKWSNQELFSYLKHGLTPDGDSAGGLMAEVIDNGLRYFSKEDLDALIEYVTSVAPIHNQLKKPKAARQKEAWE